jgi:hypothetical protein
MKLSTMLKTAAASAAVLMAAQAQAGSATNTMTNIVTVADACDVAAVGVDFGITTFPLPGTGVTSVVTNTTAGNAIQGNTGIPGAAADGGAGDALSLTTPLGAVNTVLNTALSTLTSLGLGTLPGVYVVCTTTPTSITLTSGANTVSLGTSTSLYTGTFSSKMSGTGGGASGSNQIDYSLALTGTPVATAVAGLPISIFAGAYLVTGTIPASQTGTTVVPGTYSDVATATVNF